MIITDFINANVIDEIKKEIKNSNGNEVFFRGIPDKNQIVVDVEVLARGNTNSVAALINRIRKNGKLELAGLVEIRKISEKEVGK